MRERESRLGPWLVAIGAGLWGTESAWRIPLNKVFDDPDVLVMWEHVVLVALALPFVIPRLGELRKVSWRALAWLVFSGIAGSALGAWLFTTALKPPANPTVINVVLNIQPVLSTTVAYLVFRDRLAKMFFVWAAIAVVSGAVLVGVFSSDFDVTASAGVGYALLTALCWGLATVAARGIMVEMSLPLAAGLRVIIGLVSMIVLVGAHGELNTSALWPAAASEHALETVGLLALLAGASGWVPLLLYFQGLKYTRASTAGYFEMMQTLIAAVITWAFFGAELTWWQINGAIGLAIAVALVQRAQEATALPEA